jgi:general secretion pathway protein A
VAGATRDLFSSGALGELHRLSRGVPRIINVIADRALLGAYTREVHRVTGALVRRAASEVYGRPVLAPWLRWAALAGATAGVALLAVAVWHTMPAKDSTPAAPQSAAVKIAPTVAPLPPAPAPRPELSALLALDAAGTTMESAFSSLFRMWGAEYQPANGLGCIQAATQGLTCVWQRGSLAQLKLINRPAILALIDDASSLRQVVLSGLDGGQARLLIGASEVEVPVAELADYWFGEFLVLWRPQAGEPRPLRAGMRGEDVRWLRHGLEQLGGLPVSDPARDVFDAELERLVEDFQRNRRLSVDGVAGLQTQLVLDAALGAPGTPTLVEPGTETGA